jgi:hypothetical protein
MSGNPDSRLVTRADAPLSSGASQHGWRLARSREADDVDAEVRRCQSSRPLAFQNWIRNSAAMESFLRAQRKIRENSRRRCVARDTEIQLLRLSPEPVLPCHVLSPQDFMEAEMGRGLLLWLLGVPIPVILLLWLFFGR